MYAYKKGLDAGNAGSGLHGHMARVGGIATPVDTRFGSIGSIAALIGVGLHHIFWMVHRCGGLVSGGA